MYERFPSKKRGERLSAAHINEINRVCRRVASGQNGSFVLGQSGQFQGYSSGIPLQFSLLEIDSVHEGMVYNVKLREYDSSTEAWVTGDDLYYLDGSEFGTLYQAGDKVIALWHDIREAFIPLGNAAALVLRVGKAAGAIPVNSQTGRVRIWENGAQTDTTVESVWHDWLTNNTAISDGDEVIIGWFSSESVWRVIGAGC